MKATVSVYLKGSGGAKYMYDVKAATKEQLTVKVREHMGQIWATGYRHCNGDTLEWFGPHWIDKIKAVGGIQTSYPDRMGGT